MKLSRKQKKDLALDLYLNTNKTQAEIAAIVGVTEKTVSAWKNENQWEELRGAESVTAGRIIRNLYVKAKELSEADIIDADKLIKIANSIEKLSNKKVTLSNIINVFQDFTTWAWKRDPELAKKINELQAEYVNHHING